MELVAKKGIRPFYFCGAYFMCFTINSMTTLSIKLCYVRTYAYDLLRIQQYHACMATCDAPITSQLTYVRTWVYLCRHHLRTST